MKIQPLNWIEPCSITVEKPLKLSFRFFLGNLDFYELVEKVAENVQLIPIQILLATLAKA